LIIFSVVTVLHLQFAGTFNFFRYDAYLVALGVVAVGIPAWELMKNLRDFSPLLSLGVLESGRYMYEAFGIN